MANSDSIPQSPTGQEMTAHVRDYGKFIALFKWGGIAAFIAAFFVVVFVL